MAIKLEMLKYFTAVADHGSLTAAADALGRTPSAISMMLKQLEDHLGAPLFETGRKARLSPLGELIYEEARREITHFENSLSIIEGLARSEFGYLRLAVTPSVAMTLLPDVMVLFTRNFPQVQVDIRDMDSSSISRELTRGRVDIGIGTLPEIEGMKRQELFSDAFGVICHKDHEIARNKALVTWQDIDGHTLIANGLCELIEDPDFRPILGKSRLMVRNTVSLFGLIKAGVGISVLPRMAVPQTQNDITFLPMTKEKTLRRVHVVSHASNQLMPAAREFLKLIGNVAWNKAT